MNSSKYRSLSSPLNNGVTPGPRETQKSKLASFSLFPLLPAELQHLMFEGEFEKGGLVGVHRR